MSDLWGRDRPWKINVVTYNGDAGIVTDEGLYVCNVPHEVAEQIVRDHNDAARLEADLRAAREEAAGLRAENERLRAALIHRCVVKTIDTRCEGCQEIAALLAPAAPEPSSGGDA